MVAQNQDSAYEQGVVNRLWRQYSQFRNVEVPDIESRGQLPINQRRDIWGEGLRNYLNSFVQNVWRQAFLKDREVSRQKFCQYVGLCVWDPFRNESPDNWALSDPAINEIPNEFKLYKDIIDGRRTVIEEEPDSKTKKRRLRLSNIKDRNVLGDSDASEGRHRVNAFYLLYKALKKEVITIEVPYNECPTSLKTFNELFDPDTASESGVKIEKDFDRVVDAHLPFAPSSKDGVRYIYYIPSLFYPKGAGTGIGGLMLISSYGFSPDTLQTFQTVVDTILTKVGLKYLYGNFFDQSARSAISSIMARNMSHNIGSHVIPRATVNAVKRRLIGMKLWLIALEEDGIKLISRLKGRLDEYTQRKADFLAEVTTEPLMTSRPAFFYREVILPLVENPLFMDNIAANEGVRYDDAGESNRLKIRVHINGHELKAVYKCSRCEEESRKCVYVYPDRLPYSLTCQKHVSEQLQVSDILGGDHDVEVELPGPLGEFALYSFLENYIRNAAKHNKESLKNAESLEVNIHLDEIELDLDYYRIRVWNNLVDHTKAVSIDVDGKICTDIHGAISEYICSPIIHGDGSLKRQAWGISELKICAALLKGPKDLVSEVESGRQSLFFELDTKVDKKPRLVYSFYMMKSKKVCAVLPSWGEDYAKRLRREGVWVFNCINDLKEELAKGKSMASFRFALFDCTANAGEEREQIICELRGSDNSQRPTLMSKFPFRILALTDESTPSNFPKWVHQIREPLDEERFRTGASWVLPWLWGQWIRRWLVQGPARKGAVVHIYLEQAADDSPTSKWAQHAREFNQSSDGVQVKVYERQEQGLVRDISGVEMWGSHLDLIYDRHRGLRDELEDVLRDGQGWTYIFLEKSSPDFITLFSPKFPNAGQKPALVESRKEPWLLPWELAEAGLLRILVIDERAAEFSMDSVGGETGGILFGLLRIAMGDDLPPDVQARKWHLAWAAKVYVCTHFGFEREAVPLHERVESAGLRAPYLKIRAGRKDLDCQLSVDGEQESNFSADVVLIHQGVLDEWRDRLGAEFKQGEFIDRLRSHFPFVVVESGRGIPTNLSESEKFLPFSLLQHNILGDNVGKFGLTRILMSLARRRGRETA
jgi:hypothetical protein